MTNPTSPAQGEPPEIRRNDDGTIDEVVAHGDFHLEQMDTGHWWLAVTYPNGDRVTVNLHSRGNIQVNAEIEGKFSAALSQGEPHAGSAEPIWPSAKVTVHEAEEKFGVHVVSATLYAPGLPPGDYDMFLPTSP